MKDKILIHETNPHGCGVIAYNGNTYQYSSDDDEIGDIRTAMEFLMGIGFIPRDRVAIFEGDEIYEKVVVE